MVEHSQKSKQICQFAIEFYDHGSLPFDDISKRMAPSCLGDMGLR